MLEIVIVLSLETVWFGNWHDWHLAHLLVDYVSNFWFNFDSFGWCLVLSVSTCHFNILSWHFKAEFDIGCWHIILTYFIWSYSQFWLTFSTFASRYIRNFWFNFDNFDWCLLLSFSTSHFIVWSLAFLGLVWPWELTFETFISYSLLRRAFSYNVTFFTSELKVTYISGTFGFRWIWHFLLMSITLS